MRYIFFFLLFILIQPEIFAQAPQGLNYQGIARNSNGSILPGQSIGVRFSILDGSATAPIVYQETHLATTNNFGLFTLAIGRGTSTSGNFTGINWATGNKFLKVEIAPQGGSNYQFQGTTQLLSVPYALYAEKSGNVGAQGIRGLSILNGLQDPNNTTGMDGEFYLNTSTNRLFGPKVNGAWGAGVSLIGPTGSQGLQGPTGATGSQGPIGPIGIVGATGPTGLTGPPGPIGATGPVGATGAQGAQGAQGLTGPAGLTGPSGPIGGQGPQGISGPPGTTGATGPAGATGANGKSVLNGTTNPPATLGVDGDFYINTTTNQLFGPKANGVWGSSVSLVGPPGSPGLKSLLDLQNFPSSVTCPLGGIIVKAGEDLNNNNILDSSEVTNTKTVCFTQTTSLDKVIILHIGSTATAPSTGGAVVGGQLLKFNKSNYPYVDSIIFIAEPAVYNVGNTSIVSLYNITDNVIIANSTLTGTAFVSNPVVMQTGNLFNYLPTHDVTLGVYIQSGNGMTTVTGDCLIYLYRH